MRLSPGTRLGPYEIVAPLGAGGMGEVYRARDGRLARQVAIKVLPPRLIGDEAATARFEREAQAIAALSHPNVVAVHDFSREGSTWFIVTELLEGESLRSSIVRGPLPWRKAAEAGAAIADGLAAAHARNIVHRDLKPENVFVTSEGRIKILDFGLARSVAPEQEQEDVETARLLYTRPGTIMGTIGYMSPEQVRGESADLRSDIFSLGCILYELLTGRRAFERETAPETMTAILRDDPPKPASLGVRSSPELEHIIERCLAKDPRQRFQSASDLAFALRAAANATSSEPLVEPVRSLPRLPRWAVMTLVAAAVVATAVAGYLRWRTPAAIDSLAVLPFDNASKDPATEYLSDGISESIMNSLARVRSLRVVPRTTAFRYRGRQADLQTVAKELGVRGIVTGRVLQRGDSLVVEAELVDSDKQSQLWGERYNRHVADIFSVQEEIAQQISENLRMTLSGEDRKKIQREPTTDVGAYQLYLQGRYSWSKRTKASMLESVSLFQRAIERDPNFALAYSGLADAYTTLSNRGQIASNEAFANALSAAKRAVQLDDSLAEGHASLANVVLFFERDRATAEHEYRRAIEINPNYASAHQWYGMLLEESGRLPEAQRELSIACRLDPQSPIMASAYGWLAYNQRNDAEAARYFTRAIDLEPRFSDPYLGLGVIDENEHDWPALVTHRGKGLELAGYPDYAALLSSVHDEASYRAAMRSMLAKSETDSTPAATAADIAARAHDHEATIRLLKKACFEHNGSTAYVKVSPAFDEVRKDPRFAEILHCMGL